MSSERNDGGPAFPELGNVGHNSDWQSQNGMSLRDWFAGQAMAAMIGRPITDYPERDLPSFPEVVEDAFRYADAMIAERSK